MQLARPERRRLYAKTAGILLLAGAIQFMLAVVVAESQYPGYSTADNTLSDMSGSCPSVDPDNPLKCVDSVILQPSATIFSATAFAIGLCAAVSAFLIRSALGGRIAPALLLVVGIGAMGVAVFPGYTGIAHGIFAMVTFFSGGAAAVAFYGVLKNPAMKYLSLALGALALGAIVSIVVMANSDPFTTTLGVGGAERLVVYPVVLWMVALGGHLVALRAVKG